MHTPRPCKKLTKIWGCLWTPSRREPHQVAQHSDFPGYNPVAVVLQYKVIQYYFNTIIYTSATFIVDHFVYVACI